MVAGEHRAREVELQRVEDRDRRDGPRQPHPLGLADREPGGDGRRQAAGREPRRVDRHHAGGLEQLARPVLQVEALEPPWQQQDEKWLVHRCLTL